MTSHPDQPRRAAIYARISQDRDGTSLGVQRQEADCRQLVEDRGWTLAAVYVDDDQSAYSGKPRPQYEAMLAALQRGEADAVVAYNADRLTRHPRELERLVDVLNAAGATVATTSGGDLDLGTADGRMVARVLGTIARHQSERAGERVRRKALERAEHGLPNGGRRSYGWTASGGQIIEAEAIEIRAMAARIIAGERVGAIVADLNARGVPSSTGGQWSSLTVRQLLRAPRLCGMRVYSGEVLDGVHLVGPAILTVDQSARLRAMLQPGQAPRQARRLLVPLLYCSGCGGKMVSSGEGRYACKPELGGCGTSVRAALIEPEVLRAAQDREQFVDDVIARRQAAEADDDDTAGLDADRAQLAELERGWDARQIDLNAYLRLRAPVLDRIKAGEDRARSAGGAMVLGPKLRARSWDGLTIEDQRLRLARLVERIDVARGTKGLRFARGRVTITWL